MTYFSMRGYFEPRSESRPDLADLAMLQESNRRMREREARKMRRFTIICGIATALIVVFLLVLNIHEHRNMSPAQQATLAANPQYN